jgi:hypothetical protein
VTHKKAGEWILFITSAELLNLAADYHLNSLWAREQHLDYAENLVRPRINFSCYGSYTAKAVWWTCTMFGSDGYAL